MKHKKAVSPEKGRRTAGFERLAIKGTVCLQKLKGNEETGIDVFFSPSNRGPSCNQNCRHCYFFSYYSGKEGIIPASQVPDVLLKLKSQGYKKFYPITSELLLAENWKEILAATGDQYLSSNGILIAYGGQKLLDELYTCGIREIVITASITSSHDSLHFVSKEVVEAAFNEIKKFNSENLGRRFSIVATIVITSENYNKVAEMCKHAYEVYGANIVKFVALVPIFTEHSDFSPSIEQLRIAVSQMIRAREFYPHDKLYIQRSGTLGTYGLAEEKKKKICPAGETILAIHSMDEEAPVTPCIFMPSFPIGHIEKGEIVLDETHNSFIQFKTSALNSGYCPAYALGTHIDF